MYNAIMEMEPGDRMDALVHMAIFGECGHVHINHLKIDGRGADDFMVYTQCYDCGLVDPTDDTLLCRCSLYSSTMPGATIARQFLMKELDINPNIFYISIYPVISSNYIVDVFWTESWRKIPSNRIKGRNLPEAVCKAFLLIAAAKGVEAIVSLHQLK